jgi:hypothetical protein
MTTESFNVGWLVEPSPDCKVICLVAARGLSADIPSCLHSLFGASAVAADLMMKEYGRFFGIPTVC